MEKVCSSWKHAMKSCNSTAPSRYTPWLMLAEPPRSLKHQLYNLRNGHIRHVELPQPPLLYEDNEEDELDVHHLFHDEDHGEWRYFSSRGWLVSLTQNHFNITLVNPFTAQTIHVPRAPMKFIQCDQGDWDPNYYQFQFRKFCLSDTPVITSSSNKDFTLAMIFRSEQGIGFWRSGDDDWTYVDPDFRATCAIGDLDYLDVTIYKGEFYCVNQQTEVYALGKANAIGSAWTPPWPRFVASLDSPLVNETEAYLVESGGSLLLVIREPLWGYTNLCEQECFFYETHYFTVWDVNVETGQLTEVDNLGNRALFIGWNSSFSLEASPTRGCLPNCIYYTDDFWIYYTSNKCRPGGSDMGVYDMSIRHKIKECYDGPSRFSNITPPIWLEPCNPVT